MSNDQALIAKALEYIEKVQAGLAELVDAKKKLSERPTSVDIPQILECIFDFEKERREKFNVLKSAIDASFKNGGTDDSSKGAAAGNQKNESHVPSRDLVAKQQEIPQTRRVTIEK